jgi:hypothetical protein
MQLESDDAVRRALQDLAHEAPAYQDRSAGSGTQLTAGHGNRSWLLAAATAAVIAVIVVPVGVYLATTTNDGSSPQVVESVGEGTREPTPTPRPELATADKVRAVGQQLQKADGEPGFGKVVLDIPARTVTVFWDGEPPPSVTAVRDDAAAAGVTVVIVEAQFSTDELVAASNRILNDSRSVTHVRPNDDLSGLVVGYLPEDLPSSPEDIDALVDHLEEVSGGIPVEIEEGSPVVNLEQP